MELVWYTTITTNLTITHHHHQHCHRSIQHHHHPIITTVTIIAITVFITVILTITITILPWCWLLTCFLILDLLVVVLSFVEYIRLLTGAVAVTNPRVSPLLQIMEHHTMAITAFTSRSSPPAYHITITITIILPRHYDHHHHHYHHRHYYHCHISRLQHASHQVSCLLLFCLTKIHSCSGWYGCSG